MTIQPVDPRSRPARGTGELLVTGATGMVGRHLCRILSKRKLRFRALVRPTSDRSLLEGFGGWLIEGDLTRPESLKQPLEGVRQVIHLAGAVRAQDPSLYSTVNTQGTENLLRAANDAGAERLVLLSSDTVAKVDRDAYATSKAASEQEAWRVAREGSLTCVVLRAPMILGPGSRHLRVLQRLARLPAVPVPRGAARRRPVWVGDVSHALLQALQIPQEALPNTAIDLGGAEALSLGELIQAVAKCRQQRPPKLLHVTPRSLTAVAGLMEQLGFSLPVGRKVVSSLTEEIPYDPGPASKLINWEPTPLTSALDLSLNDH
ncbi:MAG TPA: hypothetical protein DIU15_20615 [Deltaproteobacteria bacterium]|nr:hypothetical protein [Deltaproteobacteria bacterium]HCP48452.1 hypothetical protein [Deltaproteobacteria bacterium]